MAFTIELGRSFVELYSIFTKNKHFSFTKAMREFQLYRRGRYVEFNLITDRGTRWVTKDGGTRACTVGLSSDIEERGGGDMTRQTTERNVFTFSVFPPAPCLQLWPQLQWADRVHLGLASVHGALRLRL